MTNGNGHEEHHQSDGEQKRHKNHLKNMPLQDIVLFVAMQDPDDAYYRSDALAYGFKSVLSEYPRLHYLFEGDEPSALRRILDVRQEIYLTSNGRNYIERSTRRDFPQAMDDLNALSDKVWKAARQYLGKD
jgi:hypothetical protein